MTETITTREIYDKLLELQKEVNIIKNRVFDEDTIMTPEEEVQFERAMKELEEGQTFSIEDIEKDRENA